MNLYELEYRGCDEYGCGHYLASRGTRKHVGVDLVCTNKPINSIVDGVVTKVGWAYSDPKKSRLRYVEVKKGEYFYRTLYLNPNVSSGDHVSKDTVIGHSESLQEFYPRMKDHVHLEIFKLKNPSKGKARKNRAYIDPTPILEFLR